MPTKLDAAALGSRVSDIPQPRDKLAKETKMRRVKKLSLNLRTKIASGIFYQKNLLFIIFIIFYQKINI